MNDIKSKVCSKCMERKLLEDFHKSPNGLYGRHSRCKKCRKNEHYDVIVLRTCTECGCFIQHPLVLHCRGCVKKLHNSREQTARHNPSKYSKCKNKPKSLPKNPNEREHEKYKIVREYLDKNFGKLMHDQKVESLGTFATAQVFHRDKKCGVRKKKDGTPDWKKEKQEIDLLMAKTFSSKKREYNKTEGDMKRGIYDE